jgi:hypothetical protein
MEKIIWKNLNGFKNIINNTYQVSSLGDVRIKKGKKILHRKIANKKNHPYYAVYLRNNKGTGEWVLVHQLVAFCFIKIPKKYEGRTDLVPDHLDNNGLNNYYKNLSWKTRGENVSKAFKCKEINTFGENCCWAIITDEQARQICKYLEENLSYTEILKKMDLEDNKSNRILLVRIKNRIAWKEISKDYKFSMNTKYSDTQLETIRNIPRIQRLISEGKKNAEIAHIIWSNIPHAKIGPKAQTISKIRKGLIFKDILNGSTTIESIISGEILR